MKVDQYYEVRFRNQPRARYTSHRYSFANDVTMEFRREISLSGVPIPGQLFWLHFDPATGRSIGEDFTGKIVDESGWREKAVSNKPYFMISESYFFDEWIEGSNRKALALDEQRLDWSGFVKGKWDHLSRAFADYGWKQMVCRIVPKDCERTV